MSPIAIEAASPPHSRSFMRRFAGAPLPWIMPVIIVIGIFYLYPVIDVFCLSFTNATLIGDNPVYTLGTISNALAWRVISGDIVENPTDLAKAKKAFDELVALGAVFGYDAGQQSGCAAPTDFLLVIDPRGKKVYTIELTPCDES